MTVPYRGEWTKNFPEKRPSVPYRGAISVPYRGGFSVPYNGDPLYINNGVYILDLCWVHSFFQKFLEYVQYINSAISVLCNTLKLRHKQNAKHIGFVNQLSEMQQIENFIL